MDMTNKQTAVSIQSMVNSSQLCFNRTVNSSHDYRLWRVDWQPDTLAPGHFGTSSWTLALVQTF